MKKLQPFSKTEFTGAISTPALLFMVVISSGIFYSVSGYAQFTILSPPATCQVIEDMDVDNAGRIVFATDDGILIYDTSQTWIHFNTSNGLTNAHILAVKHTAHGIVFSEMNNKRVGTCDYTSASDTVFNPAFNYGYVSALHIDSLGNTLLGTDNGVVFLQDTAGTISQLNLGITLGVVNHFAFVTNPPLNSTDFYGITSGDRGVLFDLATNHTILVVSTSTTPLPSNNIISSTFVNGFAYDGTANGLFQVNFNSFPSLSVAVLNTSNTPLPSDTINAAAVSGTSLFVGTHHGLAVRMNNIWKTFTTANSNLPSNEIGELALHNHDLWIGTRQGHICRIDTAQIMSAINEISNSGEIINVILCPDNSCITLNSMTRIDGTFFLYDITGRLITGSAINSNETSIPVKNFSGGMYFYQVIDKSGNLLRGGKLMLHASVN